jgi:hypothetical protein
MKVFVQPLHYYLDLRQWYAVKPVEPESEMFFVSTTIAMTVAGAAEKTIVEQIFEKLNIPSGTEVFVASPESEQHFISLLNDKERNMKPNENSNGS